MVVEKEGISEASPVGPGNRWDVRERVVSRLTPRFRSRCGACVMRAPFSRLGMLEKGQVWKKEAGFIHVTFEDGPVTHTGRDVKKAAQCGS